jgi:signal transduction histidine kinase
LFNLNEASDYLDVDRVRLAFIEVYQAYHRWLNLSPAERADQTSIVHQAIDDLAVAVEYELSNLNTEAGRQDARTRALLVAVGLMTAVHVLVIGWLLRRWLLRPMERLNRQVEALARDEPAAEPLLESPPEMANLAHALDRARLSLGQLREQLLDAERLTTIGRFAAQLAHNLRNPLASIRAIAQVTARKSSDRDEIAEKMNEIIMSADRLDRWVARLMEVARGEPTPTQEVDVVPTLYRVREALRTDLADKELTLTIDAPDQGIICPHDPQTLEHALIAMVTNAIEASPLGDTITIHATCEVDGDQRRMCRIAVSDHGEGLPADDPDQVFEVTYSTKFRGMGLGLALARQALKRQGGSAHAENRPDGGATLSVELPIEV